MSTGNKPIYVFANSGPTVIGFLRTELDTDQIASRKNQSEQIRSYAARTGLREPYILPVADMRTLRSQVQPGSIVVVPRVSSLLRRPSDVDELLQWIVADKVVVHVVELNGPIDDRLSTVRMVSECYIPLETEIMSLKSQLADRDAMHEAIQNEIIGIATSRLAARFMGIRDDVKQIKAEARAAAQTPLVVQRRARAAQLIEQQGVAGHLQALCASQ